MMGGWPSLILLLTLMSAVYASTVDNDSAVILLLSEKPVRKDLRVDWEGDVKIFSGYVKVDEEKDINLFFWFCKAKKKKVPVLLWLNGGPGYSSAIGAMLENGPYQFSENGTVTEREHAWTNEFHMLYVDNPVGVGYSFSSKGTVQTNMDDIAHSLYKLLQYLASKVFFTLFQNGFYIGGQSYAGKYIPHLGKYIHEQKQNAQKTKPLLRLRGIFLGNALCDPETMFPALPDYLYQLGIFSETSRDLYRQNLSEMIQTTIDNGNQFDVEYGVPQIFDMLEKAQPDATNLFGPEQSILNSIGILQEFMNDSLTRQSLHAGLSGNYNVFNEDIFNAVLPVDFILGTREQMKLLMNNYKVLMYSGNLDLLVTTDMTEEFLRHVDWQGREQYRQSQYNKWTFGENRTGGWYAIVENFYRVIVRNAGHNVPFDQPQASLEMMKCFVKGQFAELITSKAEKKKIQYTF